MWLYFSIKDVGIAHRIFVYEVYKQKIFKNYYNSLIWYVRLSHYEPAR